MNDLKVVEIFVSLQGEGGRAGEASIFVRLAGCNQNCWYCDTKFDSGKSMTVADILVDLYRCYPVRWIVWTGGEPTLQLTEEHIKFFHEKGFKQAIETNGSNLIPPALDYVTISPKGNAYKLIENIGNVKVNEIRFPVHVEGWEDDLDYIPEIKDLPKADHYFLSPIFLGEEKSRLAFDKKAFQKCLDYILEEEPIWKISTQLHKLWGLK
jgi:organic radical activating enzyme